MTDIYHYDKKKEGQTLIKTDTGKRKKEQFIEHLKEGDVVTDFFAVKMKNAPRSYKRGTWFDFLATDKTGEISVKYWGGENRDRVKRLFDSFTIGDVVQIRTGSVELYEEKPQISINETTGGLRRCSPNEYDPADFIPSLEEDSIKKLFSYTQEQIKRVKNPQLQQLLSEFFSDKGFVNHYVHAPSAVSHHHNYVGGNLEHAVGVLRLCITFCELYPSVHKDLLITGAILHDVGKLKEYSYQAAIEKTEEGNLIGHIVMGDQWIKEKIQNLRKKSDFSKELEQHLSHLILSHHGKLEWGSPKIPGTIEACILHYADLMDSQIKYFQQNIEDAKKITSDRWSYVYDSDLGGKKPIFLGKIEEKE